jgi:hypothetical protein
MSVCLLGGNDQNQFFLEFIIWCLTGILKNFINKYFAKNDQRIFIKGLIISNLFQIGCLMNIGVNPPGFYKPGLMKYRVGKVTTLKSTAYKSCCPENSLL